MKQLTEDDPIVENIDDDDDVDKYRQTFEQSMKDRFEVEFCSECGGDWYDHAESDYQQRNEGWEYYCKAFEDPEYLVRENERGARCKCKHFKKDHIKQGCNTGECECEERPSSYILYKRFLIMQTKLTIYGMKEIHGNISKLTKDFVQERNKEIKELEINLEDRRIVKLQEEYLPKIKENIVRNQIFNKEERWKN